MILPQVGYEEWARRYNMAVEEEPCLKCKRIFKTTEPYARGRKRGLRAELHECGENYRLHTHIDLDTRGEWAWMVREMLSSANTQEESHE